MGHRKVIQSYYEDINNITELLNKYINSYRLLIGGANDLSSNVFAKKSDVKDTLKRAEELGDIIDDLIEVLNDISYNYMDYCKLKSKIIKYKIREEYINVEIDEDFKL